MPRMPAPADLRWNEEGVPRSAAFDDVYYSRAGGLAEAEAVFLAGCGLPDAWRGRRAFTVLELGFGSGLNMLALWRLWRGARPTGAVLHAVSIEAAPMSVADAERAHAAFPEIADLAARLRAVWPVRAFGAQRLWFEEDGFALTIVHGDADEVLPRLAARADAVFLDGFTPARNPAMWSAAVIGAAAQCMAPGARLATYSVAGDVRRALTAHGFAVHKQPGFAGKRERLEAHLENPAAPRTSFFPDAPATGRIAIIGGGVAAACLAHALARRDRRCTIIARGADGASFNPAAIVMPRLDRDRAAPTARLHLEAFLYAAPFYERLGLLDPCGVLEREQEEGALADMIADPPLPAEWYAPAAGGALHKRAGVISPTKTVARLLHGATQIPADVHSLARAGDVWTLRGADGALIAEAECVILANGADIAQFDESAWLPIRLSRGQVEWAPGLNAPGAHAIVRSAYLAPSRDGVAFGATFDPVEKGHVPQADNASRARNLDSLRTLMPDVHERVRESALTSRASVRATTPDRSPLLGLMPDSSEWLRVYQDIAFGRTPPPIAPPCLDGLYVFGGLGARGFTLAPLLAESLASALCDEPRPLAQDVLDAIHPARFLMRALKRRENILA